MKITHICLAASYVEGFGYQENILTEYHRSFGYDVDVITSDYVFNSKYEKTVRKERDYVNEYGIHVSVVDRKKFLGRYVCNNFSGLHERLVDSAPDIIFVHGGQFWALKDVIRYCREHRNVKLYIDQHGDYYNTPVDTFKRMMIQKSILGHWMRKAQKYCIRFWGVTPWRCQYLHDVYGIRKDKIDLLVMGGDDRYIHLDSMPGLRVDIRKRLGLSDDDFVVITGGKIDETKNIHLLMQAVRDSDRDDLKLIVFGQPSREMESAIESLAEDDHIRYIGWLDSKDVYDYFLASDLAVFPGTHSVLWEQACACGLPGVFKDWEGMHHVDLCGNCRFLTSDSVEEMKAVILSIHDSPDAYAEMKKVAVEKGIAAFSYLQIAKRAIGIED